MESMYMYKLSKIFNDLILSSSIKISFYNTTTIMWMSCLLFYKWVHFQLWMFNLYYLFTYLFPNLPPLCPSLTESLTPPPFFSQRGCPFHSILPPWHNQIYARLGIFLSHCGQTRKLCWWMYFTVRLQLRDRPCSSY